MALSSPALGARFSMPITSVRTVLCPTNIMLLIPGFLSSAASKYPSKSVNEPSRPASMPPLARPGSTDGSIGTALKPQLPATTVVTPCASLNSIPGWRKKAPSSWECVSIKPGARYWPFPSTSSLPDPALPTSVIRPFLMPTSPVKACPPSPSRIWTFLIVMSFIGCPVRAIGSVQAVFVAIRQSSHQS